MVVGDLPRLCGPVLCTRAAFFFRLSDTVVLWERYATRKRIFGSLSSNL